jgi:MYXO-CTERM domain-containing protein
MKRRTEPRQLGVLALATFIAGGCAGDGCNGCVGTTPGGFPHSERIENAAQLRLAASAIETVEAEPAALVASFLGTGPDVVVEIPPVCGGDEPYVCCTAGGAAPVSPCGPIAVDLAAQAGDLPRLQIDPLEGQNRVDVTVRARVASAKSIPVEASYEGLPVRCNVAVNTTRGSVDDFRFDLDFALVPDEVSGTTRLEVLTAELSQVEPEDLTITGSGGNTITCGLAEVFFKETFIEQLIANVPDLARNAVAGQFCDPCPGGQLEECSETADACEEGRCMRGAVCEQELGIAGRLAARTLFGGISNGQLGAMDIYQVAGGYAESNAGGVSLGVLGGALPAASERDRCGPPSEQPAPVAVPTSDYFRGNSRPDTAQEFGFALGVHQHQLDMLGWAAYESGLLCATVGTPTVSLLTSDTLAAFVPSLMDLMHGRVSPLYVGLRPQRPPALQIGRNRFTEAGEIEEPLVDVRLEGAEIDVFAMVDDQLIRIMTIVTDLNLPVGVEVDDQGSLIPVLGDLGDALSNLSVKSSEALRESPDSLAEILPSLLAAALPALGDAFGPIALPSIGPLRLEVLPDGITAVEDRAFLAVVGQVSVAPAGQAASAARAAGRSDRGREPGPRADATARLLAWRPPALADLRGGAGARPMVELDLGGQAGRTGAPLEWSIRVDGGLWSPYTRLPRLAVSRASLLLPGDHVIEVRAREVGRPLTTDPVPAVVRLSNRPASSGSAGGPGQLVQFHGQGGGGCDCRVGSSAPGGALSLLAVIGMALLRLRRRRRRARSRRRRRFGTGSALLVLLAGALLSGCSCGNSEVCAGADGECMEGEVERGPTGRWSSLAVSSERLVAAAYEESLGDLVVIEIAGGGAAEYTVVDGIPDGVVPTYSPDGYRRGVTEAGPDVGAFTSIALDGERALVAYHAQDGGQLRLALESTGGWLVGEVDSDPDNDAARVGLYASLAVDSEGVPAIAYLATGVDDGDGGRLSQLRYARATSAVPAGPEDWEVTVLDELPISCAGLCSEGAACIAQDSGEVCRWITTDCSEDCADGSACIAGSCRAAVPAPPVYDIPRGTGLHARLVLLPDGRPVVVYYDREEGDLILLAQQGGWERTELDAGAGADTGMWAAAMGDGSGVVHVAYQDALGDQLLYTTWRGGSAGAVEVVDDGMRPGEWRSHPVGASAAIFRDSSGDVAIAYQDGATSDLMIARRLGGSWTRDDLLPGPLLDGFHISAASKEGRSALASYQYDLAIYPPGVLEILLDP